MRDHVCVKFIRRQLSLSKLRPQPSPFSVREYSELKSAAVHGNGVSATCKFSFSSFDFSLYVFAPRAHIFNLFWGGVVIQQPVSEISLGSLAQPNYHEPFNLNTDETLI